MRPVRLLIDSLKDEEFVLRRKRLGFEPARSIPVSRIRRFEARVGLELPRDYVDFLATYGAARYFGVRLLGLSEIQPVYRYRPTQVTSRSIPATGVILFAEVDFLPRAERFQFAFIFRADLAEASPESERARVRAWVGDAAMGWHTAGMPSKTFAAWLANWHRLIQRKAERSSSSVSAPSARQRKRAQRE